MKKLLLTCFMSCLGLLSVKAQCNTPTVLSPLAFCSGTATTVEATASPSLVSFTLNMADSWGDGWNGGSVSIYADGVPVLEDATILSGDQGTETFEAPEGSTLTATWVPGGYPLEISFDLLDNNGISVSSGGTTETIDYDIPSDTYTLNWYDAPGGTNIGSGSPLDVTSLITGAGAYSFFVTQTGVSCTESAAAEVVVNISGVNVEIIAQDVSCTGNADGSFAVGAIECGTLPFNFSVDGGSFGPAPTDLTEGSYTIIVEDGALLQSSPIILEIGASSTVIPSPPTTDSLVAACSGVSSLLLNAQGSPSTVTFTLNMIDSFGDGWNGNAITILADGIPIVDNATFETGFLGIETFEAPEGSTLSAQWTEGLYITEVSFEILDANGIIIASGDFNGVEDYAIPVTVINTNVNWYDAASGGNFEGTGSPFEAVGTVLMPEASAGTYNFFVTQFDGGCESSAVIVVVEISGTNAEIIAQDVSCIGNTDGSFALGAIECGTLPFTYSVDGGAFDTIPTNLGEGTYTIIIQDSLEIQSPPITLEIGAPATVIPVAPTADSLVSVCSGSLSVPLNAQGRPIGIPASFTLNMIDSWGDGWNGNAITILADGIPIVEDATFLTGSLGIESFEAPEGSTLTVEWTLGSFSNEVSFEILDANGIIIASGEFDGVVNYETPATVFNTTDLNWYDAASGGNLQGTGAPFEALGTGVMPEAATGSYNFFVTQFDEGCESVAIPVTVEVTGVNVTYSVTNEGCTGYANGGLVIEDTLCGTPPFLYSVDGGEFDVAPSLGQGDYTIVIQDSLLEESAPIYITIVTLDSVTTDPPLADSMVYVCTGDTSILLNASPIIFTSSFTLNMADSYGDGWNGNEITIFADGVPVIENATILTGDSGTETFEAIEGAVITAEWVTGTYQLEVSFELLENGVLVSDGSVGATIDYTVPANAYSFNWYDASTGGVLQGNGIPFEAVGTELLPTSENGTYDFYVTQLNGGCESSTTPVTVNISNVNLSLASINATCNTGNDGSFLLTNVSCGTLPFTFSVNGGEAGAPPTDMTPGTYEIMVIDSLGDSSNVYYLTIGSADGPSDLVVNELTDTSINVSWVSNGTESAWTVEYGAAGFTAGAGEEIGSISVTDTVVFINNLSANTSYDFYVVADCGTGVNGDWTLLPFTTNCGFYTVPFAETFEDDSDTRICWYNINELATVDWTYGTGAGFGTAGNDLIDNAFEGDLNAVMGSPLTTNPSITKLASPRIDMSGQDSVAIVFAYAQELYSFFGGVVNTMRVYKRVGDTLPWVEIAAYSENTPDWTLDTLFVADSSNQLEIAFEVEFIGGYPNVVDQVQILPCNVAPGIDGGGNVCRLDNTVDLNQFITAGETYGYWSFPANETFVNGSIADVQFLPEGSHDFLYIVKTPCVSDTTVATLVIYGPSSAGDDGADSVCLNEPYNLLTSLSGNIDLGGDWIDPQGNNLGSPNISASNIPGSYNYQYITSNGVCDADTSTVLLFVDGGCDFLSLMEVDMGFFELYPNPTSGIFNIQANEAEGLFSVDVTDLNGRIIETFKNYITGNEIKSIDLKNSETGTYFVKIYNDNVFKTFRVVKN